MSSTIPTVMEPVVKAAIARAPMVIVGGGDGTLSAVVDHFVGKDTVFAVLPLGTANSFARIARPSARPRRGDRGHRLWPAQADRPWDDQRRLFRQCRGAGDEPADRRHRARRAEALSRHGRLHDLGGPGGVQVPAVPAARHARGWDDRDKCWATEARIANGSSPWRRRAGRGSQARQRRDGHPGGDREEPVGLAWSWFATLFSCAGATRR